MIEAMPPEEYQNIQTQPTPLEESGEVTVPSEDISQSRGVSPFWYVLGGVVVLVVVGVGTVAFAFPEFGRWILGGDFPRLTTIEQEFDSQAFNAQNREEIPTGTMFEPDPKYGVNYLSLIGQYPFLERPPEGGILVSTNDDGTQEVLGDRIARQLATALLLKPEELVSIRLFNDGTVDVQSTNNLYLDFDIDGEIMSKMQKEFEGTDWESQMSELSSECQTKENVSLILLIPAPGGQQYQLSDCGVRALNEKPAIKAFIEVFTIASEELEAKLSQIDSESRLSRLAAKQKKLSITGSFIDLALQEVVTIDSTLFDAVELQVFESGDTSGIEREFDIPVEATYMEFWYGFPEDGDGDWLTLHVNGALAWVMGGNTVGSIDSNNGKYERARIPIRQFAGNENATIKLELHGRRIEPASVQIADIQIVGYSTR